MMTISLENLDLTRFERYHALIEDVRAFESVLKMPLPRTIWTNRLRITSSRLQRILLADGFHPTPLPWLPEAFRVPEPALKLGRHWAYHAGLFHIQEASSMLPVQLLGARPGERILDLCAAPGNKTGQLAVAMDNTGTVVANDANAMRTRAIRMNADRLGLVNVSVTQANGMNFPKAAGRFDRVLVDVPCSCEGISRKNPRILREPQGLFEAFRNRQQALLQRALQLCRVGGRIVYSTCTYAPEENEWIIQEILEKYPGRTRILPADIPGVVASPGVTGWAGRKLDPCLERTRRIWPHQNDTGGFYLALLEKTGEIGSTPNPDPPALEEPEYEPPVGNAQAVMDEMDETVSRLFDRFGLNNRILQGLRLLGGGKSVCLAARDHRPPRGPSPVIGLPLVHRSMKYPKLTTAGAAFLGQSATRNVIEVSLPQALDFLSRSDIHLTNGRLPQCRGDGYVLIRMKGFGLGIGLYIEEEARVASFYPKSAALRNRSESDTPGDRGPEYR